MNTRTLLAGAALALAVATPSFAAGGFSPVIGIALTEGGETDVKLDDDSTRTIHTGGLLHLFAGFEYRADQSPLSFQANVGYHVDNIDAGSGDARFSRIPFELLAFWNTADNFRFGGGLRRATGSMIHSAGMVVNIKMRTSVGVIVQGEYLFGEHASVFLRYVHEDYESHRLPGGEISADHGGIGMSYRF
jgi:hypothetical protein